MHFIGKCLYRIDLTFLNTGKRFSYVDVSYHNVPRYDKKKKKHSTTVYHLVIAIISLISRSQAVTNGFRNVFLLRIVRYTLHCDTNVTTLLGNGLV